MKAVGVTRPECQRASLMAFLLHTIRILVLVAFLVGNAVFVAPLYSQDEFRWSEQRRVPGYASDTKSPVLIADRNYAVHVFNTTDLGEQKAIVYSQWTWNTGWTIPVDIILPALKDEARIKGAFLDSRGLVHLVFFSGDQEQSGIFYASAPLIDADHAPSWSSSTLIGGAAESFPDVADLVGNSKDRLFVLFSRASPSNGLYATQSMDRGFSWSEPSPMFLTYDENLKPNGLQMIVDDEDNVHAVWDVVNEEGHSQAVYYSRLEEGQLEWAVPVQLSADAIGTQNAASIVEHEGQLIVIFHANADDGLTRFMIHSSDEGQTWSDRTRLFPHVGSNGPASFVVDSNNQLHAFFGNRVTPNNQATVHGMWQSTWENGQWSVPQAVVSGPRVIDDDGGNGFDPSFAEAVVSQGNRILVTWETDPDAGLNGIWYSAASILTPELPTVVLPTAATMPITEETIEAVPLVVTEAVSTPLVPPIAIVDSEPGSNTSSPVHPVVIGVFPVVLLVALVPLASWLLRRL